LKSFVLYNGEQYEWIQNLAAGVWETATELVVIGVKYEVMEAREEIEHKNSASQGCGGYPKFQAHHLRRCGLFGTGTPCRINFQGATPLDPVTA
jgi:hypothetical protein